MLQNKIIGGRVSGKSRRPCSGPTESDLQRDPPLHRTRSLTAVWQGKIRRLIINLPPRHSLAEQAMAHLRGRSRRWTGTKS